MITCRLAEENTARRGRTQEFSEAYKLHLNITVVWLFLIGADLLDAVSVWGEGQGEAWYVTFATTT